MDTFGLYTGMRASLGALRTQAAKVVAGIDAGTANVDWIFNGVGWDFDREQSMLTFYWLASDPAHVFAWADFALGDETEAETEARITLGYGKPIPGGDIARIVEVVTERDRDKLIGAFRLFKDDATMNVGQRLVAVRTALEASRDASRAIFTLSGDATTYTYRTAPGGKIVVWPKTVTEYGADFSGLRAALATLIAEIDATV